MQATIESVMSRVGYEVPPHLAAQAEVPELTGMQRQGDVMIIPMRAGEVANLVPVAPAGTVVVQGENMRTSHIVIGDGNVKVALRNRGTDVGTLVVEEDSVAWLVHDGEHGPKGIAAGSYLIRRQRQQLDEIALVRD